MYTGTLINDLLRTVELAETYSHAITRATQYNNDSDLGEPTLEYERRTRG